MAHRNTIFAQLLGHVSRHDFETLARKHHRGQKLRQASRWDQFVAMSLAHLSGRQSLRDIVSNQKAQSRRLYHTGSRGIARSTLARLNQKQSAHLYQDLFYHLYTRCQSLSPKHPFRFKHKLYSLDASMIHLSLKIFPWAKFNRVKAAVKLHVGLDHDGFLPAFVEITQSKFSDLEGSEEFHFPPHSIVVFDRGYHNYSSYQKLTDRRVFFVTRLRKNAIFQTLEHYPVTQGQGVLSDQKITWNGTYSIKLKTSSLRLVVYNDQESGKIFQFLTNHFDLDAKMIADIYKQRWQIELFFKWLKQHLQIRSFLGTTLNAVETQIWIALCVHLVLAYVKYLAHSIFSLHQILGLMQINLFIKRNLLELLHNQLPQTIPKMQCQQCSLF